MNQHPQQGDVYIAGLDPTVGHEMQKARPCLVISPDEMNQRMQTVIVAPLTTVRTRYLFRTRCTFDGRQAEVAVDQMRAVDRTRLRKSIGRVQDDVLRQVMARLVEMFT